MRCSCSMSWTCNSRNSFSWVCIASCGEYPALSFREELFDQRSKRPPAFAACALRSCVIAVLSVTIVKYLDRRYILNVRVAHSTARASFSHVLYGRIALDKVHDANEMTRSLPSMRWRRTAPRPVVHSPFPKARRWGKDPTCSSAVSALVASVSSGGPSPILNDSVLLRVVRSPEFEA